MDAAPTALETRHHNRIADLAPEAAAWRHDLHRHPEIGFEERRTAAFVAERLRAFGVDEVIEGIARTGVVGLIRGRAEGPAIGLRADMDALPMQERNAFDHASTIPGRMHACGHDGHTAMLLAAARVLAETRDFAGTVAVIFQPAEEGGGGGREMMEDGLVARTGIASVWGLHNWPGLPLGTFATLEGPVMAGIDYFDVSVRGQGTHAGTPHNGADTVLAAAHLVTTIQSVPGRSLPPTAVATVGVSMFKGADAHVIMPAEAKIGGSVRYFDPAARDRAEARIRTLATSVAAAFECEAAIDYRRNYPPCLNPGPEREIAAEVAAGLVGEARVIREHEPSMAGEDFAFMLDERPGHYVWMGTASPDHRSGALHYPDYDFNDAAIPHGVAWWLALVDRLLPA